MVLTLALPLTLAACSGEEPDTDSARQRAESEAATTPSGQATTDAEAATEDADDSATIGQPLTVSGAEIIPRNLRQADDANSDSTCVDVDITVGPEAEPLDIHGLAAWKLYDPSNTSRLQTVNDDTVNLPDVVNPGEEARGTICFEDTPGDPGDYELRFRSGDDPLANEAVWMGSL